jgi:xylan 1,4-beta-xylosidase
MTSYLLKSLAVPLVLIASLIAQQKPRVISADFGQMKGKRDLAYRLCVGSERAGVMMRAGNQAQLKRVHDELGFQYIRFHGIFHDDMGVYREVNGKPVYEFGNVDQLYDAILQIGMKPFIELSFMPHDLISGSQEVFWWKGNVTPPKDMGKWSALVEAFTRHLQARYGDQEVGKWFFEVWNEPNYIGFWPNTDQAKYFELYDATVAAVKKVNPEYRVGGPATAGAGWVPEFIEHTVKTGVPVDFISTHTYGVSQGFLDEFGQSDQVLDERPSAIVGDVQMVSDQIKASARPGLPLYFTEWSTSYSTRDPVHDAYVSAPYILEKLKRAEGRTLAMSYWTYSDLFEEGGPPPSTFHGGFGLLTREGIPKASYFAYKYLQMLGPDELENADSSSWLTRDGGNFSALLWGLHLIKQSAGDKEVYRKKHPPAKQADVQLRLTGMPPGKYRLEIRRTGYEANDAYSAYLDMGMPKDPTPAQFETLFQKASDSLETSEVIEVTKDGHLDRSLPIRENDTVYVSLKRI